MRRIHSYHVELVVHWGYLALVFYYCFDHIQTCVLPILNVLLLQVPDVDFPHNSQELMLQGLVYDLVDHVELRLQVELVLYGGLLDSGGVGWDHGSQTTVVNFYKGSSGQGRVHHQ